jgi:hypothetical protein
MIKAKITTAPIFPGSAEGEIFNTIVTIPKTATNIVPPSGLKVNVLSYLLLYQET